MPKKFRGENTKAATARAAKAARAAEEKERIERAKEDAKWVDDNKHVVRKQQRKEDREQKAQEIAARKAELRKLAEEEMAAAAGSTTSKTQQQPTKVTRHQLETRKEQLEKQAAEEAERRRLAQQKIVVVDHDEPLEENVNRLTIEGEEARTVDEAISILRNDTAETAAAVIDRHPEKRLKAAYNAYEAKRLPLLKEEKPTLRLSQLKQIIKKDWMKAPENPLNARMAQVNQVKEKIAETDTA